jgi:putative ABC transport system permease protein
MKLQDPPKWASKLLGWFCRKELFDFIYGDLLEIYDKRIIKKGKFKADVGFVFDVFSLFRPFALKGTRTNSNKYAMLKNYLKVAFRNLLRHKLYSSIKIGGLGLGIAACILISLFIKDELSFDKGFEHSDQIYRIVNTWNRPGEEVKWVAQEPPLLGVIDNEMPEVEAACRIVPYGRMLAGSNLFRRSDQMQNNFEDGFIYADHSIIDVFDLSLTYGDRNTALTAPASILLTQNKADQYFPGQNPVGQTVIFNDDGKPYKIDGVIENLPEKTHFNFDFVITMIGEEMWPGEHLSWCCSNFDIYMKIREDSKPASVVAQLYKVRDSYMTDYMKSKGRTDIDQMKYRGYELQKLSAIHLESSDISDNYSHGDIRIVWMFAAVAFLILTLACINFINLSTAKSANRAKEVGLRKVVGSQKIDLIGQFLSESILFSIISLFVGLLLALAALPVFNQIANKDLMLPFGDWAFLPFAFLLVVLVGTIAGLYPAFYLSGFRPIEVLKGKLSLGSKSAHLQNGMVIFQFVVSTILIISALVVNEQMSFILNKKLGFNKDQVVLLQGTNTLGPKLNTLKNELRELSEVQNVSVTSFLPLEGMAQDGNQFWLEGRTKEDAPINSQLWRVDGSYLNTLGMNLVKGRNFDELLDSDSSSIIVNEKMVEKFGFENPIGQRITNGYEKPRTIIGVVENFHFRSMKGEINALTMVLGSQDDVTAVKLHTGDMGASLAKITAIWNGLVANQPIRYEFMDDRFEAMYDDVKRTGLLFTSFSVLAIIIACLGLFALSTFMVEQRRKEISVRKVLGASVGSLMNTLTSNFLKLVAISMIISIPVGWYAMTNWLQNYQYKIDLSWGLFLVAGLVISAISMITISYEIIRAIRLNPADALQSE